MAVCHFDVWLPFWAASIIPLTDFFSSLFVTIHLLFLFSFLFRPLCFKSGNFMMTSWWIIAVLTKSLFQIATEKHIDLAPVQSVLDKKTILLDVSLQLISVEMLFCGHYPVQSAPWRCVGTFLKHEDLASLGKMFHSLKGCFTSGWDLRPDQIATVRDIVWQAL